MPGRMITAILLMIMSLSYAAGYQQEMREQKRQQTMAGFLDNQLQEIER